MSDLGWLQKYVAESNRIEGILRKPRRIEVDAHLRFITLEEITVEDLVTFVGVVQPNACLRNRPEVPGVRVGNHIAPPSGAKVELELIVLLSRVRYGHRDSEHAFIAHCEYEKLHPFTDGNGRSGRALWLWMMLLGSERDIIQATELGFLHTFYYQTLSASRL